MRDGLPRGGPRKTESVIVNLDSAEGLGTHWVAYKKNNGIVKYYDSFGDLQPPLELVCYLHSGIHPAKKIYYSYQRQQNFGTVYCGHLCLIFLLCKE